MKTLFTLLLCLLITSAKTQETETIQIGTQTWMKSNLNTGTRISLTQQGTNDYQVQKYCYMNLESNCTIYGALYSWNEMMAYSAAQGSQGICPDGFRVPTKTDWDILIEYATDLSYDPGITLPFDPSANKNLKEAGFAHWYSPYNTPVAIAKYSQSQRDAENARIEGTDAFGFSALPSGYCIYYGQGQSVSASKGKWGYWWTSTTTPEGWGQYVTTYYALGTVQIHSAYKSGSFANYFPVRCIKN